MPALWPRPTLWSAAATLLNNFLPRNRALGYRRVIPLIGIAPIPNRRSGCTGIGGVTIVISIIIGSRCQRATEQSEANAETYCRSNSPAATVMTMMPAATATMPATAVPVATTGMPATASAMPAATVPITAATVPAATGAMSAAVMVSERGYCRTCQQHRRRRQSH